MSGETRVENSGAVALGGGTVNVSGGMVAAGRDLFVRELNVLMADRAPSPDSITIPGHDGDICPFPGLDPFSADDAGFFFGRDEDARNVREMVVVGELSAVVGSSGCGKSSLLAAAVVPALADGGSDRPPSFPIVIKPGRTPVDLVADRLAQHLPDLTGDSVATSIREDHEALAALSDRASRELGRPVIWVVDQFEEVFDPAVSGGDRAVLLRGLRAGRRSAVLVAMRSDFYQHLDAAPALARLVAARQHRLTPLGDAALREAVERPAERVHLRTEPGLADQIVRDAASSGGALPFVAMALKETWRRRANGWLTLAGYLASGGVTGAIQQTADAAWTALAEADRPTARRMLSRMAHVSDLGAVTRRRCPATEFVTSRDDEAAVLRVLQPLVRARLLTMDTTQHQSQDGTSDALPVPAVEIAHEALLTAWPLLHDWLATDRDNKRIQDDLASAAMAWEGSRRDPAFLYTGVRLATLLAAQDSLSPNTNETAFMRASQHLARRQRRRGLLLLALPVALIVALVVAGVTLIQQRATAREKTLADASQLAAESRATANDDRSLAALLAVIGDRTAHNETTWGTLVDTLGNREGPVTYIRGTKGAINAIAPQIDDGQVVTAASDGIAEARSAQDGRQLGQISSGRPLKAVDVSGQYVLTEDVVGGLTLVVKGSGTPLLQIPGPTNEDIALDAQHRMIVAAGTDGQVRRWWYAVEPGGRARLVRSATDPVSVYSVAVDADGGVVAAVWDGSLRYLPAAEQATTATLAPPNTLDAGTDLRFRIVLTAHSELAAVDGAHLTIWTLTRTDRSVALESQRQVSYPDGYSITGYSLGSNPTNEGLLTGTKTGAVTQWALSSGPPARQATLTGGGTDPVAELATDGHWGVGRTNTGIAVSWDLGGRASPAAHPVPIGREDPTSAAYHADGTLAMGGTRGTVNTLRAGDLGAPGTPSLVGEIPTSVAAVTWWGDRLVAAGRDGSLFAFSADGRRATISPAGGAAVTGLASAGAVTAVGRENGQIDLIGPEGPRSLDGRGGSSSAIALSRDGRWLASGTSRPEDNYDILLWDLRVAGTPRRLHAHNLFVSALAFTPDGQRLASGSDDRDIRLWSTDTGEQLATLKGHLDTVRALAFSPDGETLASTGDDQTVRIWDAASTKPVGRPLPIGNQPLLALAASPDGAVLVAAGNGDLAAIPFEASAWQRLACTFAGRELTPTEQDRYLSTGSEGPSAC